MFFLGPLFRREQETAILENTSSKTVQNQANSFQWNVIDGLKDNGIDDIKIVNVLPVGTYPKGYNKLVLKDERWGDSNMEIGSPNLPFIKQYVRYKKIKKLLKNIHNETVIIYSTYLPFLKAVNKLGSDVKVALIVTDLPEYYDLAKTNSIRAFFRKRNNKKIYNCLNRIDKYILLTEQMKERLPVGDKEYTIVEGIIGDIKEAVPHDSKDKFIITYCGTLNSQFGIKHLVDSVIALQNEKIELHLFGNGDAVDYISEVSSNNPNIVFHGFVSKNEIEDFYKQTHLLVNPRTNQGEYTKYSFPSKTMEYMLSGIPFLGYKLDGIPAEYYDYINVIECTPCSMQEKIMEIFKNYGFYREKSMRGRNFIIENKNREAQARKIIDLINP